MRCRILGKLTFKPLKEYNYIILFEIFGFECFKTRRGFKQLPFWFLLVSVINKAQIKFMRKRNSWVALLPWITLAPPLLICWIYGRHLNWIGNQWPRPKESGTGVYGIYCSRTTIESNKRQYRPGLERPNLINNAANLHASGRRACFVYMLCACVYECVCKCHTCPCKQRTKNCPFVAYKNNGPKNLKSISNVLAKANWFMCCVQVCCVNWNGIRVRLGLCIGRCVCL